jgi:hypothetical protein
VLIELIGRIEEDEDGGWEDGMKGGCAKMQVYDWLFSGNASAEFK